MAIVGLTDQFDAKMEKGPRGRLIRIGWLQKGRREGFGKDIKLFDDQWFNFRATDTNGIGARLEELFTAVYDDKPTEIGDVRIPHLSGNFSIESCAWLTASKHTQRGSVFLGESDGEWVTRLRSEETGKVERYEKGKLAHTAVSHDDGSKYGAVKYKGKLYPWQQSMAVDLILVKLNEAMFKERLSGLGVVTLITHSTYDIPVLIREYYGMLNEVLNLVANPFDQVSVDTTKRHIPLRNIPLRLYRSEDAVTTPDYRSKDAGSRLNSTRWLLHWQLAPEFSLAAHQAMQKRTERTLEAIANLPMLQASQPSGEEIDDMLSYGDPQTKQIAPEAEPVPSEYQGPEWEDLDEVDEGDFVEENEPPPLDWQHQAETAVSIDALAMALYKLHEPSGVFDDANHTLKGIKHICGSKPENGRAIAAIGKYVTAVADGAKRKDAAAAARGFYGREPVVEQEPLFPEQETAVTGNNYDND